MIETERLFLRKITQDDVDLIFDINNPPECTFLHSGIAVTLEVCKDTIKMWEELHKETVDIGTFCVEDKESKYKIGIAYILSYIEPNQFEIGFRLRKAYWNSGYAAEIARGFISYAEHNLNADAIIAKVYEHDTRLRNKFADLSFEVVGTAYGGIGLLYKYTIDK